MNDLRNAIDESSRRAMTGMHIPWLLDQWVQRTPDKTFLIWEPFEGTPDTWSFSRLQRDARNIAANLHARGVQAGDFVIIHMDNSPEFILSWFACAELGAVAVSTNTRSVARDLEYFAEHTEAVCALTQPQFAEMIAGACGDLELLVVTDNDCGVPGEVDPAWNATRFADLLVDAPPLPERTIDAQDPLSVQFTSGTTSRPKAVLWTQANGIWAGKVTAAHAQLRHDDRTLVFMPLFHTNAQGYSMLASLWVGATIVVQPRFSSSRFWELSVKHELTWLSTIPFAWKAIADQPVPQHQYRMWLTAAHLPELSDAFGVPTIFGLWGMTETLTQGIVTDATHRGPRGTIGRVAPEYELQIRREDGSLAGPGERGLLWIRGVRGVSLFKEYYRNEEANQKAFDADGWFETGDIVVSDAEGWLYFSDRDKDMLKVGAENVAASEIESVILLTGSVEEAAVVAQKHPMLDEVPVAFVIPKAGANAAIADEIIDFCRENLADFKVPRAVHLVDELPRSTLNKVAKAELRARLAEEDTPAN